MRKLAFALFAVSFAALPSAPAAASCYQSPCAAQVQRPAWNPCCNAGPAYWVQQIAQPCCYAQPPVASPCCAQPYQYRHHHRTYAPAVYRHHRHYFRPQHRWVRPALYQPHRRPFVQPYRHTNVRPFHRTYRAPMFRPHRSFVRPMHRVVQKPLQRPMMQPNRPVKPKK